MIKFYQSKTILRKYKQPDEWFRIKYSMNLYRGCQHQCIYCDSRSECYRIEDFNDIMVKENALILLKKEIARLKEKNVIGTGAMNDAYMPVEKTLEMTRKALQIINQFSFPFHIITKSNLVLRDIDLIKTSNSGYTPVTFSITTTDDNLAKILEPGASLPSERFNAMKFLSNEKILTGVALMPVIPHITDSVGNILDIVEKSFESGASYILPAFGVTLRDSQSQYFFEKLKLLLPEKFNLISKEYNGTYIYNSPDSIKLYNTLSEKCKKYKVSLKIPDYKPVPDQFSLFD